MKKSRNPEYCMNKIDKKKTVKIPISNIMLYSLLIAVFFVISISSISIVSLLQINIVFADPPTPRNIEGRVFYSDGTTGVENGIPVLINNTNSGDYVLTYVYAPPIPSLKGLYSATIQGSDNNIIKVMSWDPTHYGISIGTLLPTTTKIDVILNLTRPSETNITIIEPENNTIVLLDYIFNVTANITLIGGQDGTGCYAEINFTHDQIVSVHLDESIHYLGNINLGSSITTTWEVEGISGGYSNITVYSYCDSDDIIFDNANYYTIYNIYVNDTIPPNVTLISPLNNTWTNNNNITFYYNATDASGIKSCALYINDILKSTNSTVASGELSYFEIYNLSQGNHSWFVSCLDDSDNLNQGDSPKNYINIDLAVPKVTLISPKNRSTRINNTVIFEFNVTDSYGEIENCSLILNNEARLTRNDIIQNITQNITITLAGGYYNWSILCFDKAGNFHHPDDLILNVTDPDLAVFSEDIVFSTDRPVENQLVIINATIHNIGNENATNVIVQFFENEPYDAQIGDNITINVSMGESVTVNTTWLSRIGSYNIHVVVDPPYETNGTIRELNESNNLANRTLFVSAYTIYYGEVKSNIVLINPSNISVFTWFNETNINANLYVADADSMISWSSLFPLGRNLTNQISIKDFEKADAALNLTNLSDSLNTTYTLNGSIRQVETFVIYNKTLDYVPVVNSTNTSNFITGVLWDTSEGGQSFDTTQDLVFVTKINNNLPGKYGIYDYEIRIPATLRGYVIPNNNNRVAFYVELT